MFHTQSSPCLPVPQSANFTNSFPITLFADPHPLSPVESYRFKNIGWRGRALPSNFQLSSFSIHPFYFLHLTHSFPQRAPFLRSRQSAEPNRQEFCRWLPLICSCLARRRRWRLRAFWRRGGRGLRASGSGRCRAAGGDVAEESWTASLDRRGDRARRRVLRREADRARLPWWRTAVRRLVRRGGRGTRDFLL